MQWSLIVLSVLGGMVAMTITARILRKAHRTPPPPEKPVPPTKIDVNVRFMPSGFCPGCSAVLAEIDAELEEFERRMKQFDESGSASTGVDQRRLEYVRYLVKKGYLSEDL